MINLKNNSSHVNWSTPALLIPKVNLHVNNNNLHNLSGLQFANCCLQTTIVAKKFSASSINSQECSICKDEHHTCYGSLFLTPYAMDKTATLNNAEEDEIEAKGGTGLTLSCPPDSLQVWNDKAKCYVKSLKYAQDWQDNWGAQNEI